MGRIRANREFLKFAILSAALVVTLALLSEVFIKAFVDPLLPAGGGDSLGYVAVAILMFLLFLAAAWAAGQQAGRILGVEVKAFDAMRQPGLPFLVMGYSPLRISSDRIHQELELLGASAVASDVESYRKACASSDRDPIAPNPWQQNLRSAWHHARQGKLKAIYVLDPDVSQFGLLRAYLKAALDSIDADIEIVQICERGRPNQPFSVHDGSGQEEKRGYENYTYVYEGLLRALEMIHERADADALVGPRSPFPKSLFDHSRGERLDELTCVDATPGQKPFSIAAAVLTLNRPLRFSYVTTGDGSTSVGGEVRFYDTNLRFAAGLN